MSDSEYGECEPGAGGYQVAVYKNNNIKKLLPLNEHSYKYVKSKFKKHGPSYSKEAASSSLKSKAKTPKEKKKKNKQKTTSSSSSSTAAAAVTSPAADKPKRVMTDKQKQALAEGRKKRAAQLAEQKKISTS